MNPPAQWFSAVVLVLQAALVIAAPMPVCFMPDGDGSILRVGAFATLSTRDAATGGIVSWADDALLSVTALLPIAVQHFNERRAEIVPAFGDLASCNASLRIAALIDDGGESTLATRGFFDSGYDCFDAVFGPYLSASAEAVAAIAGSLNMPAISNLVTLDSFADLKRYPTFARTVPAEAALADAIAELLVSMNYTHVAVACVADDRAWASALILAAEARGLYVFPALWENPDNGAVMKESMAGALASLAKYGPRVIVTHADYAVTLETLASVAASGGLLTSDYLWVASGMAVRQKVAMNVPVSPSVLEFLRGAIVVTATIEPNRRFSRLLSAWDSFSTDDVSKEVANASLPLPADFFHRTSNLALAEWAWTYDAVAALGIAACRALASGSLVSNGRAVSRDLFGMQFEGASGTVRILANGNRDPSSSAFTAAVPVVDLNASSSRPLRLSTWAVYAGSNWTFPPNTLVRFRSGSAIPPADVVAPAENLNFLPLWARVLGYVEGIVVGIVWLATELFVGKYSQARGIAEGQPLLLSAIDVGLLVVGLVVVPLTIESNDAACMATPWMIGLGGCLLLAGIATKSHRLFVLWRQVERHGGRARREKNTVQYLAGIVVPVAIQSALLAGWTVQAPLVYRRFVTATDSLGFPLESFGACSTDMWQTGVWLGANLFTLCILAVIAAVAAYRTRDLPAEFTEARGLFFASLTLFQAFVVGVPLVAAVYTSVLGRFVALSSLCFVTVAALWSAIFLPRVLATLAVSAAQKGRAFARTSRTRASPTSSSRVEREAAETVE